MNSIIKTMIVIAIAVGVSGCASGSKSLAVLDTLSNGRASQINDKALNRAADSIDRYCALVPEDQRLGLRGEVNGRTADGNRIVITCK